MTCPHDFVERETAVTADGYCPLCLAAINAELVAVLKRIAECDPQGNESVGIDEMVHGCFEWMREEARAILAKARGEK